MFGAIKRYFSEHKVDTPDGGFGVPKSGRSSVENVNNLSGVLDYFNGYYNVIDRNLVSGDLLDTLVRIAVANADASQAVRQWINLGNRGHDIIIDDPKTALVDEALAALNDNAYRLYTKSAGVDGLFNHYFWQLGVFGALASEDVIAGDYSRVEKVAPISPRFIRFKLEGDDYVPYQRLTNREMIELNSYTFAYYCYLSFENSPYGIPPVLAALDPLHTQKFMHENVKYISEKMGLTGFTGVEVTPPPRNPGEIDSEYQKRVTKHLNNVMEGFKANYRKGLAVHANDIKVTHTNTTGDARGAYEIHKLNEEQVFSGINNDPAMHGRSYSTTETYADVVYNLLINQTNSFRQLVKRRHERTLRLDLALRGIFPEEVSLQMAGDDQRDSKKEAETEQIRWQVVKEKVERGLLEPDRAAQELGYDDWYDPSLIGGRVLPGTMRRKKATHRFRFDRKSQQYVFVRPRLATLAKKDKGKELLQDYEQALRSLLESGRDQALDDVRDYLERRGFNGDNVDGLARETFAIVQAAYSTQLTGEAAEKIIREAVNASYTFFRLSDVSLWPKGKAPVSMALDSVDNRTISFLESLDNFYLGKFIENSDVEGPALNFLRSHYLENGEAIFGRTSGEQLERFRALFKDRLEELADHAVQRIIDTSVQRMRVWGHIGQMAEAGIEYARPVNPSPQAAICKYVTSNDVRIPIGTARQAVARLSSLSPEGFRGFLESNGQIKPDTIKDFGIDAATAEGIGFPPYHPRCHTTLEAIV